MLHLPFMLLNRAVRFPSHFCNWGALEQPPQFSPLSPSAFSSAGHWSLELPCPNHGVEPFTCLLLPAALLWLLCCARASAHCLALLFPSQICLLFSEAPSWSSYPSCLSCPPSFPPSASESSTVHCLFVPSACLTYRELNYYLTLALYSFQQVIPPLCWLS